MCVCVFVDVHTIARMWKSVLSSHHVGVRHQTQVIRLGLKSLYLPSHLVDSDILNLMVRL